MYKYILIIVLFICADLLAQSTPTYTTNYNLRKWAQGANPTADSLNANWTAIDTLIKVRVDSITAHRTGLNTLMDSITAHRTALGTGSNMDLSTDQTAAGTKTFSGTAKVSGTLNVTGKTIFKADTMAFVPTYIDVGSAGTFIVLTATSAGDLETISSGTDGQYIIITCASAFTVTLKDGVDNISSAGDFAMGQYDTISLIYNSTTAKWQEISRSNN